MLVVLALTAAAVDVDVREEGARGSPRMVGLAGAYRGIAEGAVAQSLNPAAIAVAPHSAEPGRWWVDGLFFVSGLVPVLERLRDEGLSDAPLPTAAVTGGLVVGRDGQAGSLLVSVRNLRDRDSQRSSLVVETGLGWGAALLDEQVHIGLMPGLTLVRTTPRVQGLGAVLPTLSAGARWAVPDTPVRLGLSGRTPWRTPLEDAPVDAVRLPWELGAGIAVRHGRMSRGPRYPAPAGEGENPGFREDPGADRVFVQWAFDLALVGPQADTTTLEAWTRDDPRSASSEVTLTVATGVEAEPLRHRLRTRIGLYTQPARLRLTSLRLHGTLGLDVALFEWPRGRARWRLSPTVDASAGGIRPGLGVGLW